MLMIIGCNRYSYWIGNLLFDFTMFMVTIIFLFILPYLFGIDLIYESGTHIAVFIFLSIGFGISMIAFSYAIGFIFKKSNSAHKMYWLLFLSITWLLPYML